MRCAIYYPHVQIQSERVVKTALLTWDYIETIAPWSDYRGYYSNKYIEEAMDLIGKRRCPTETEAKEVHEILEKTIDNGIPDVFRYLEHDNNKIDIYPQKLMQETWRMLEDHGIAKYNNISGRYDARSVASLKIMSMLADVMAGETRVRITDRMLAYAAVSAVLGETDRDRLSSSTIEQVVSVTFKSISPDMVDIRRLIEIRKREEKSNGNDYRYLRHKYSDRIEKHLKEAAQLQPNSPDRIELDRIFEMEMEDDFRDLKDELRISRRSALFSKETVGFVAGALVSVGTLAASLSAPLVVPPALSLVGMPVAAAGLYGAMSKSQVDRRSILRSHPMAYMYELSEARLR